MLAFQSDEQREHMLNEHTKVKGETTLDRTPIDEGRREIRDAGFSRKESRQTFGVTDVALPLLGPSGQVIAALTCLYMRRIDEYITPSVDEVTALLQNAASSLSMTHD